MSKEPLKLKLAPSPKQESNVQAVAYLEQLLQQAKDGQLTEFCMMYEASGELHSCWTGCSDLLRLIGYLERMKHNTMRRMERLLDDH